MAFDTGKLFVIFVCFLITFIAYSPQKLIWFWLGGLNVNSVLIMSTFNALVAMIWWNYYLTCSTDPGRVPKDWVGTDTQVALLTNIATRS